MTIGSFGFHNHELHIGEGAKKPPQQSAFYYGGCHHKQEPVKVGRFVVTCSSGIGIHDLKPPYPDFGIYLASLWRDLLGKSWTNGSYLKKLAQERPYPALVRDCLDGGAIPVRDLYTLVEICLSKMRRGLIIDIGCSAGHGRTGTLLACLIARVEHWGAEEAIEVTRSRYCQFAIESASQEDSVRQYVEKFGVRRSK